MPRTTRSWPRPASAAQRVLHRGELLAELCAEKRLIAVSGTHGKTTTTAMLVWALRAAGADPAFFLGGELPGAGEGGEAANAGWGEGEWVVAEADESDGSFLRLRPEVAVVTNLEMDHHSRWGSLAELRDAFAQLRRAGARRGAAGRWRPRPARRRGAEALRFDPGRPRTGASSSSPFPAATTCSTRALPWRRSSWPALDRRPAPGPCRLPRGEAAARAEGRRAAAPASTTTTPTTRPRCGPRWRPCGSSDPAG